LIPTKFFGFRTILPSEILNYRQKGSDNKGLEAHLHIVANTRVEVIIIDKTMISFLEENV